MNLTKEKKEERKRKKIGRKEKKEGKKYILTQITSMSDQHASHTQLEII